MTADTMSQYYRESFTADERQILSRFFTNVDGPVFALVNLPEVVKGALFARYSRSHKSIRRLFLDEFVKNPDLGIGALADYAADEGGGVDVQRAGRLYEKVFTDFGDDSVAQLGGVHVACEQASNLLTKVLEWGRLAAYLEQSTRFIYYDKKLGDRYRYMTPPEIRGSRLEREYERTLNHTFDVYSGLLTRLAQYYSELEPKPSDVPVPTWESVVRARVCDDARGLLPAATLSNVGIYANGQAFEALLLRMRVHPLGEVREYADLLLTELRKVIPAFMRRVDLPDRGGAWSRYLAEIAQRMARLGAHLQAPTDSEHEVELVEWDPDAELKIAAAALYQYSALSDAQLLEHVKGLSDEQRREILKAYVGQRENRRHKPGRAMERCSYRFDVFSDYGLFRDLQRHRMLTLEWQKLDPDNGYVTPASLGKIAAEGEWHGTIKQLFGLYAEIESLAGTDAAQYALPFACKMRFYLQLNVREAFHLLELRTAPGGHPGYRRICQRMHQLIREQAGHTVLADAMRFVNHDEYQLGRLPAERRNAWRRRTEASE